MTIELNKVFKTEIEKIKKNLENEIGKLCDKMMNEENKEWKRKFKECSNELEVLKRELNGK